MSYQTDLYYRNRNDRICTRCRKNPVYEGNKRCYECIENQKDYYKRHKEQKQIAGLCLRCETKATAGNLCLLHWVESLCGAGGISRDHSSDLIIKLEQQNYKCYYSGRLLIPSNNASIDHMTPKSRGGESELYNLVWCDFNINLSKRNLTHDEFIDMCQQVVLIGNKKIFTTGLNNLPRNNFNRKLM